MGRQGDKGTRGQGEKPNYQLPITNYQLPITNYQLPITNCISNLRNYLLVSAENLTLQLVRYQHQQMKSFHQGCLTADLMSQE
ncbi:hypothetical protein PI95_012590 [Hassallia byssoidea VB512170]|uniref:Uncharacterized protein n=1 Tax=Hassallia byssoidea VB512170 TaxID=1304833 RepID=A0A846HA94_9CYAN|nr:hypothetical protein [Hassalia byssoidea VB512170]